MTGAFQESAKNLLRTAAKALVVTYCYFDELPRLEDIEPLTHTDVLVANSRVDQRLIRNAVDAVFDAHPALGSVFEPRLDAWTLRPGGGWGWGVEPPGVAIEDVIARQRASFDMHTGRLFAVSLLLEPPTGWCSPQASSAWTTTRGRSWSKTCWPHMARMPWPPSRRT